MIEPKARSFLFPNKGSFTSFLFLLLNASINALICNMHAIINIDICLIQIFVSTCIFCFHLKRRIDAFK